MDLNDYHDNLVCKSEYNEEKTLVTISWKRPTIPLPITFSLITSSRSPRAMTKNELNDDPYHYIEKLCTTSNRIETKS